LKDPRRRLTNDKEKEKNIKRVVRSSEEVYWILGSAEGLIGKLMVVSKGLFWLGRIMKRRCGSAEARKKKKKKMMMKKGEGKEEGGKEAI
jgi:hypothetical protein